MKKFIIKLPNYNMCIESLFKHFNLICIVFWCLSQCILTDLLIEKDTHIKQLQVVIDYIDEW